MKYLLSSFLVLLGFNIFVWSHIIFTHDNSLNVFFMDVGQGDSELIILPGGVKVLIDGGPNKSVLFELDKVLQQMDRYIDLVVITHPQVDHFGGLYDVLERYRVGAVIATGRDGTGKAWQDFVELIKKKSIPVVIVGAKDYIRYRESSFTILSPGRELLNNKELNESSIVLGLESEGIKIMFTGDAGFLVDNFLSDNYDINIDVLKVAHHGSKYATGQRFLRKATPLISVIEVGKNKFGHPTQKTLNRLKLIGSRIYRTDYNGTVHLKINNGIINTSSYKTP